MPSKIEHISLLESPEYFSLTKFCEKKGIDKNQVTKLLWIINAEPHLTRLMPILSNLNSIIQTAFEANIIPKKDISDAKNCQLLIHQLLKDPQDLIDDYKHSVSPPKLRIRDKNFADHPLRGICLINNPLYALLWNEVSTTNPKTNSIPSNRLDTEYQEPKKTLQLLQWHLFYIHQDLIRKHTTLRGYLKQSNKNKPFLGKHNNSLAQSCRSARDSHHYSNWHQLKKFDFEQPTLEIARQFAQSSNDTLNPLSSLKALSKKWQKNRACLRYVILEKRFYAKRRKSTSYYVAYDDHTFISHQKNGKDLTFRPKKKVMIPRNTIY